MRALGMLSESAARAQINEQSSAQSISITVVGVEPDGTKELLNASAAEHERLFRLPEGSIGRLESAPVESTPELLPPVVPTYVEPQEWSYCSWRGHGSYQGAESPQCLKQGKKELRVGVIPGTPGWTQYPAESAFLRPRAHSVLRVLDPVGQSIEVVPQVAEIHHLSMISSRASASFLVI
jgi:hypothetical protein